MTHPDGSRDFSRYLSAQKENPEIYIKNRVLPYWRLQDGGWERELHDLFYTQPQLKSCQDNIDAFKRMKAKFDARGIKLTIIVMPTFAAELFKYATPQFSDYLKELTAIKDIWNFGGINNVNINPYNFSDGGHCFDFVAENIIAKVFSHSANSSEVSSTDLDAFGVLLTTENIDAYIARQTEKWMSLKAEYDATGTIALQGKDDASYLGE